MKYVYVTFVCIFLNSCYTKQWVKLTGKEKDFVHPNAAVQNVFNVDDGILLASIPNRIASDYQLGKELLFPVNSIEADVFEYGILTLNELTPPNTLRSELSLHTSKNDIWSISNIDLLELLPKIDKDTNLVYPTIKITSVSRIKYWTGKEVNGIYFRPAFGKSKRVSTSVNKNFVLSIAPNLIDSDQLELKITISQKQKLGKLEREKMGTKEVIRKSSYRFAFSKELYGALSNQPQDQAGL